MSTMCPSVTLCFSHSSQYGVQAVLCRLSFADCADYCQRSPPGCASIQHQLSVLMIKQLAIICGTNHLHHRLQVCYSGQDCIAFDIDIDVCFWCPGPIG